jgi:predicted ABC-class ATPase
MHVDNALAQSQEGHHSTSGDASLWISTKPGETGSTTVSSTNWASGAINGVAIVVRGSAPDAPTPIISHILR